MNSKKARAENVRNAILNGAVKIGTENDYGRGLANFFKSSKLLRTQGSPRFSLSLFQIAAVITAGILLVIFLLQMKDNRVNREIFEFYEESPATTTRTQALTPTSPPERIARVPNIQAENNVTLNHIVFLMNSAKYQEAISAIDRATKKPSPFIGEEGDLLAMYKIILLYETGQRAKARSLLSSVRKSATYKMKEKLDFISGLIEK